MAKRKNVLLIVLFIFSALGLLSLALEGLFEVAVGDTLTLISFILVGIGLMVLSNILGVRKFMDDGKLDGDELASIIIASIGFVILVIAGIDLLNFAFLPEATSRVIQGVAAFLLLVIISVQMAMSLRRSG